MDVTLATGKTYGVEALRLGQVKRMVAATDAGRALEATIQACSESTGVSISDLEDSLTIAEANELFGHVMEMSGLKVGGATATGSTSTISTAASVPTVQ